MNETTSKKHGVITGDPTGARLDIIIDDAGLADSIATHLGDAATIQWETEARRLTRLINSTETAPIVVGFTSVEKAGRHLKAGDPFWAFLKVAVANPRVSIYCTAEYLADAPAILRDRATHIDVLDEWLAADAEALGSDRDYDFDLRWAR